MKTRISFLLAAAIILFGSAFAQSKMLKTAKKDLGNLKLDKAVEAIELAAKDAETMSLAETWLVRGKIYTAVSASPFFKGKFGNSADIAFESFQKALELEPDAKMATIVNLELPKLADVYYNLGTDAFQEKDYVMATESFEKAYQITEKLETPDSGALFNIALCAAYGEQLEKAEKFYKILVDGNYDQTSIYTGLADVYTKMKEGAKASATMDIAIERYPSDSLLYIASATINLLNGNSVKAEEILKNAVAKWPTSDVLYFAIGVAYENNQRYEDAEKAYLKALELNPNYNDAIFNLGAYYVNKGIREKTEADNLPLSKTAEYEALSVKANETFKKAIPFLEKVIEKQPDNIAAMTTLKDIYVHTKNLEKAKEMNEKIAAMEDAQ